MIMLLSYLVEEKHTLTLYAPTQSLHCTKELTVGHVRVSVLLHRSLSRHPNTHYHQPHLGDQDPAGVAVQCRPNQ